MTYYTPGLEWPRSDGTGAAWPTAEQQKPDPVESWWEILPGSNEKYELYEKRIGQYVAEKLKAKPSAMPFRIKLPPGYVLTGHHKPRSGADQKERVDVYLKGCPSIGKKYFRSPNEFLPHVDWLLDTSKPLDDHSQCGCIYNKSSSAARQKLSKSETPVSHKRPPSATESKPSSKRRKIDPESSEEEISSVLPDRREALKSGRRFRQGETVWFRIETILPPKQEPPLPDITHWPGTVAAIKESRSMSAGGGQDGKTAPKPQDGASPKNQKHVQSTDYHIRPLGLFNRNDEVIRRSEEMLPYTIGFDLFSGKVGWGMLGKEATRIMRSGVQAELAEDKMKGTQPPTTEAELDTRWRSKWCKRYMFKETAKSWEVAAFRLSLAFKIASVIVDAWTITDKVYKIPITSISAEDKASIDNKLTTLYQGLWLGGERIWVDDMVRLKKTRGQLPRETFGVPSPGALDQAALLRIKKITVEVSPDATESIPAWRCMAYGDVYEVVDETLAQPVYSNQPTSRNIPKPRTHPTTRGHGYKRLNEPDSEVMVDIFDVAGRLYPDLLDPSTQTWYTSPLLSKEQNSGRTEPGVEAHALTGLRPGWHLASRSTKWKVDLYHLVTEANRQAEREMRTYYGTLLGVGELKRDIKKADRSNGSAKPQDASPPIQNGKLENPTLEAIRSSNGETSQAKQIITADLSS